MFSEKVQQITQSAQTAEAILTEIRQHPSPDIEYLSRRLTDYCAIRLRLHGDEISDNFVLMIQYSVAHALNISIEDLPGVDHPEVCGSSNAVMSQRIHLLLALQKGLNFHMDPKLAPEIKSIRDLASTVHAALIHRKDGGG